MREKETTADSSAIRAEIEDLRQMTVGQLRQKYIEVFGAASSFQVKWPTSGFAAR
jgi:hypothetical protein